METRKHTLLAALRAFARQRPGLDFRDYGDVKAYRSDSRSIGADLRHAEALLAAVAWRDGVTADDIIKASQHAFSGRLEITEPEPGTFKLDYVTGQYWPTEYRKAVCAVLSSALWDYWREDCETGDAIRKTARKELGRSVGQRWFN